MNAWFHHITSAYNLPRIARKLLVIFECDFTAGRNLGIRLISLLHCVVNLKSLLGITLREKCPYLELFWSVFSRIRTKYGKIRTRITPNMNTFYTL